MEHASATTLAFFRMVRLPVVTLSGPMRIRCGESTLMEFLQFKLVHNAGKTLKFGQELTYSSF